MVMDTEEFDKLAADGSNVSWYCPNSQCDKPNFSISPFSQPLVTSSENRFSVLSGSNSVPLLGSLHTPHKTRSRATNASIPMIGSVSTPSLRRSATSTSSATSIHTPSTVGIPEHTSTPQPTTTLRTTAPVRGTPKHLHKSLQRKIVVMNCQSVFNKSTELKVLLSSTMPDIVIGTESWLSPDINSTEVFPPNYNVYRKDRNRHGGGVFILVSNVLISTPLSEFTSDEHEALWVQVKEQRRPNMTIGAYYRPPSNTPEKLEEFRDIVSNVCRTTSGTIVIGGDFNAPGIDWESMSPTPQASNIRLCQCLIDMAQDQHLEQIVREATRETNILDLVFTNNPTLINNAQSMPPLCSSDHNCVFIDMNVKPVTCKQPPRRTLKYKQANWDAIRQAVKGLSNDILKGSDLMNTQDMWNTIEEGLKLIIKTHIPDKLVRAYKSPPWFNINLKRAFQERNAAYRKWLKQRNHEDEMAFRELKSKAQKLWREAKTQYINNIFGYNSEADEDAYDTKRPQTLKKFYSYVKSLKKDASGTSPLKSDGVLISDSKGKADVLNQQYASVFTEEDMTTIPDLGPSPHPKMSQPHITEKGVCKLLQNLNPNKAAGPDKISPAFLKEVCHELAPLYTKLFQKSLDEGYVPEQWRTADISPIFKKGERYEPANYRPVSLTSVTSKCLEHIVAKTIMTHLEENNLLTDTQHGFRARRSCETQILNFTQELMKGMAEGHQFDVNVMDFSKAFDRVPHQRLLRKVSHYGIINQVLSWLSSFLDKRTQRVLVDGEASDFCQVLSGVPQGTVLGPVLFLLFINDLPQMIDSPCKLFADDLLVYRRISTPQDIDALQQDLGKLEQWEDTWGMKFHPDKCEHITITRKRQPIPSTYTLRGHTLKKVTQAKYLGINMTEKLEWRRHIEITSKKANRSLGFLKRNLAHAPKEIRETAYKTLVRPQAEYCAAVWDPHTYDLAQKVEMIQRRSARFVLRRYHQMSSVGTMLEDLGWETLRVRRAKSRVTLLYKAANGLVSTECNSYLTPTTARTRRTHSNTFRQISTRTNYHQYSFYPRTIPLWNSLPAHIGEAPSLQTMREGLKTFEIPPRFL